jgi:hypothetical protein
MGRKRPGDDQDCHCHGGRLVIVIGDSNDKTIKAARDWTAAVAGTGTPLYKLAFDVKSTSPPFSAPQTVTNGQWTPIKKANGAERTAEDVRTSWDACCYFNEVLIFAHGEKVAMSDLTRLAGLYFDRPIVRLVLWLCASNRDAFPFSGHRQTFGQLCYAVRPFDECPCGCDHAKCHSISADGKKEKCPVGDGAATTIVSAGYYTADNKTYPSKLGIDPNDAKKPLVAPENRLIETTVTPGKGKSVDWTPAPVVGGSAFDRFKTKPPAAAPGPAAGYAIDPSSFSSPAPANRRREANGRNIQAR